MSYSRPAGGLRLPDYFGFRRWNRQGVITGAGGVLAAVVTVALATGCSHRLPDPQTVPGTWLIPAGQSVVRGACVDPTASSASSFAPAIVEQLADAVAEWPGPQSGVDQLPQRPALELTVRIVSTHSGSTDQRVVHVDLPAVPGLNPPPPVEDTNYATNKLEWNKQATKRANAWSEANRKADSAAKALRDLLPKEQSSEQTSAISACLAAVAASRPATPPRQLLLASDLIENETAVRGDYGGSPILIVQSCPAGTEAECPARAEEWSARLGAEGAGTVQIVRADAASAALVDWMETP